MTKRSAEHPVARQENGLEIARDETMGGGVIQEPRVLNAHGCSPIPFLSTRWGSYRPNHRSELEIRENSKLNEPPMKIYTERVTHAYWTLGQYGHRTH